MIIALILSLIALIVIDIFRTKRMISIEKSFEGFKILNSGDAKRIEILEDKIMDMQARHRKEELRDTYRTLAIMKYLEAELLNPAEYVYVVASLKYVKKNISKYRYVNPDKWYLSIKPDIVVPKWFDTKAEAAYHMQTYKLDTGRMDLSGIIFSGKSLLHESNSTCSYYLPIVNEAMRPKRKAKK